MRKPLIGITCKLIADGKDLYYRLDRNYVRSVEKAGAVPILMPFFASRKDAAAFLDRLDGVLFTGGADIHPSRWGEKKKHPKANLLVPEKEESDLLAAREALERDLPILGICLGMQELNVASGGSLHQHIYDLPNIRRHSDGARHGVELQGTSRTSDATGKVVEVNSYHHQAVRDVGRGMRVTALSPDGIIEGIESDLHRWVVGVQWHPERIADRPEQMRLFRAFVAECR
jgi:putative glutamine amidotransferase